MQRRPRARRPDRRTLRRAALCALASLLAAGACRDESRLRNFGVVEEGRIYRSGRLEPEAMRRLIEERGIRTVIDLGSWDRERAKAEEMQRIADEKGVTRYVVRMLGDGRANPNGYVAVLRLLADAKNQPVLVQCAAGSERTSAAIVLYRHVIQGRLIQPSYEESFGYGHDPEDYEWIAFLADWADEVEQAYRSGGWIPGLPPVEPQPGGWVDARPADSQWVPPDYGP